MSTLNVRFKKYKNSNIFLSKHFIQDILHRYRPTQCWTTWTIYKYSEHGHQRGIKCIYIYFQKNIFKQFYKSCAVVVVVGFLRDCFAYKMLNWSMGPYVHNIFLWFHCVEMVYFKILNCLKKKRKKNFVIFWSSATDEWKVREEWNKGNNYLDTNAYSYVLQTDLMVWYSDTKALHTYTLSLVFFRC